MIANLIESQIYAKYANKNMEPVSYYLRSKTINRAIFLSNVERTAKRNINEIDALLVR